MLRGYIRVCVGGGDAPERLGGVVEDGEDLGAGLGGGLVEAMRGKGEGRTRVSFLVFRECCTVWRSFGLGGAEGRGWKCRLSLSLLVEQLDA